MAGQTFDRTEKFEQYEIPVRNTREEVPLQYIKNADWIEVGPYGRGWFARYTDEQGDLYTVPVYFDHHFKCWTEVATQSDRMQWVKRVALSDLKLDILDQEADPEKWSTPREPE